jgi:RNA polymerase-binding transcription factor DksA
MSSQSEDIARLQVVRERTLADIERLRVELQAEIEPAPATDDDAAADVASEIYERGKIISLIRNLEAKIHSVDRAMELAAEGKYGTCEKCGEPIPVERLEIMPETTLCVRCASERETGLAGSASSRRRRAYQVLDDYETSDDQENEDED